MSLSQLHRWHWVVISIVLGLIFGTVGTDVNSGMARFTFGASGLADGSTAMVTTTCTENFQMSAQTALLIGSLLAIAYNALRSLVSARNSPSPIIFGERVLP